MTDIVLGCINAHLQKERNRSLLYGIIEDVKVDICVVSETFFRDNSSRMIEKVFGSDFMWFGRERKIRKRASGGVGILCRKSIGNFSLVKISSKYEYLWIKLDRNQDMYYICGVYIPPSKSKRELAPDVLLELEIDIRNYRKLGKVVLMGDFNCRIGGKESVIAAGSKQFTFSRTTHDMDLKDKDGKKSKDANRGSFLVTSMSASGMVVMNGIDSGGEYTFTSTNSGSSVIDLIILSDNIIAPGDCTLAPVNTDSIDDYSDFPDDTLYIRKSMSVISDFKHRIGDHSLVVCKIKTQPFSHSSSVSQPTQPTQDNDKKLDILKWDRRDGGDPTYWLKMQQALETQLSIWDAELEAAPLNTDINLIISNFVDRVNLALLSSMKIRKFKTSRRLAWNDDVFRCQIDEKDAFEAYRLAAGVDKERLHLLLKQARNRTKYARRRAERARNKRIIQDIENLKSKDPREFWHRLYSLDDSNYEDSSLPTFVKNSDGNLVSGKEAEQVWMESFRKLGLENSDFKDFDADFYNRIKAVVQDNPVVAIDNKELDQEITLEEVRKAVSQLKRGKAVGVDGVMNEVFKYGGDRVTVYLWKLFCRIFDNEVFPKQWAQGMIFPLFKGGGEEAKVDTSKYRGITLLSIIGKIYTDILNTRISDFIEKSKVLIEEQAGFRKARSTVDQLFILTEVIRNRKKPTFVAFLDVAKAYDRVWRDGLWFQLLESGIKGKMWRVLKNIYKTVESCILLGDKRTDFFQVEVGLRQGCLLSPLLFDIFINELGKEVNKLKKGVQCGNVNLSILCFADDLAVIAQSKEDLEALLKVVYDFSYRWRFKFNFDKCAVIEFHLKAPKDKKIILGNCTSICTCGHHFTFGPKLINEVLVYKYLGIDLDYRLLLKEFKQRILNKARMNLSRSWAMGMSTGYFSIKASLNLWESLVRSVVEYGCQIWGDEAWLEGEKLLHDAGRRILRCASNASLPAIRGELGLWTLRGRRDLKKLMYFAHILSLPDDRLVKQAYYLSKKRKDLKSNWCGRIKQILAKYDLSYLWYDNNLIFNLDGNQNNHSQNLKNHKSFWKSFFYKKVLVVEEKKWWEEVKSKDKLRTYILFKNPRLRLEKYLLTPGYYYSRSLVSDIRIGTNKLQIDMGRREGLEPHLRLCKQCTMNQTEDEVHFLVRCPHYNLLRNKLYADITTISNGKWHLSMWNDFQRFCFLMNGSMDSYDLKIYLLVQKYVAQAFKLRK